MRHQALAMVMGMNFGEVGYYYSHCVLLQLVGLAHDTTTHDASFQDWGRGPQPHAVPFFGVRGSSHSLFVASLVSLPAVMEVRPVAPLCFSCCVVAAPVLAQPALPFVPSLRPRSRRHGDLPCD